MNNMTIDELRKELKVSRQANEKLHEEIDRLYNELGNKIIENRELKNKIESLQDIIDSEWD